jgi:chromosome condensin MukBEF ATPase and DNA-binding subunit MukB
MNTLLIWITIAAIYIPIGIGAGCLGRQAAVRQQRKTERKRHREAFDRIAEAHGAAQPAPQELMQQAVARIRELEVELEATQGKLTDTQAGLTALAMRAHKAEAALANVKPGEPVNLGSLKRKLAQALHPDHAEPSLKAAMTAVWKKVWPIIEAA